VNTNPGGSYPQHVIFFVASKRAHQARVLNCAKLERIARDKHSSLLGQFLGYRENEMFWILSLGLYTQHFIFFVIYE